MVARGSGQPPIVDDHSGKVMAEGLNGGEVNRIKRSQAGRFDRRGSGDDPIVDSHQADATEDSLGLAFNRAILGAGRDAHDLDTGERAGQRGRASPRGTPPILAFRLLRRSV